MRSALRELRKLRRLAQRQLEVTGDNALHGQVFVQCFPTQRRAVQTQLNGRQLFVSRSAQDTKAVCRKRNLPAIGQFDEHKATTCPCANGY